MPDPIPKTVAVPLTALSASIFLIGFAAFCNASSLFTVKTLASAINLLPSFVFANFPYKSDLTNLSKPFKFVRVDFYETKDDKVLFGELTFTPARCSAEYYNDKGNNELGEMLKLK